MPSRPIGMKRSKARTSKANTSLRVARIEERPGGIANPKINAQARKLLGKHYASKYQTMRRG